MEHIFRPRHAADYLQFTCRCLRPVSVSVALGVGVIVGVAVCGTVLPGPSSASA